MGSKSILCVLCLFGALTAVACSDDDAITTASGGAGGAGGKGNAGAAGKAGTAGKAGAETGGGNTGGGSTGGGAGEAGEGGMGGAAPIGCTNFSTFVHTIIKSDTNATSTPRDVNGVTFCDTPADPAAFNDLF